eukprot:COSAG06_NODE_4519_length_4186_cov_7.042574_3_plen_262_part_00
MTGLSRARTCKQQEEESCQSRKRDREEQSCQSVSTGSRRCNGCGGCEPGSWRTVVCGSHYQDVRKDAGDQHAQHKCAQPREAKLPTPDIHPARELAASVAASAASTGNSLRGRLRGRTCCRHSCGGVGSCAGSSAGSAAAVLPVRVGMTGAATQPASQLVVEAPRTEPGRGLAGARLEGGLARPPEGKHVNTAAAAAGGGALGCEPARWAAEKPCAGLWRPRHGHGLSSRTRQSLAARDQPRCGQSPKFCLLDLARLYVSI